MSLKKGTYVQHPKDKIHEAWGIGIVLEDEKNNKAPIFFVHKSQRKIIGTDYVQLQSVADPGNAAVLLQNALYEDVGDRQPFPLVLEKFYSISLAAYVASCTLHQSVITKLKQVS